MMRLFQKERKREVKRIIYQVSKFAKAWMSVITTMIYVVLLMIYQQCIRGLEKPAGVSEAIDFLFKYPSDYMAALLIGIILHIIGIGMAAFVVLYFLGVLLGELPLNILIGANLIIGIIMIVLNLYFVQYVMALVLAMVSIFAVVWAFLNADK